MVVERGQVWWADLGEPAGSEPGFRRPVLIVQSDAFNRSRLRTVLAVVLTSNVRLVDAPGYMEWSRRKLAEGKYDFVIEELDETSVWLLPEEFAAPIDHVQSALTCLASKSRAKTAE